MLPNNEVEFLSSLILEIANELAFVAILVNRRVGVAETIINLIPYFYRV